MKKLIWIVIIVVVVSGIWYMLKNKGQEKQSQTSQSPAPSTQQPTQKIQENIVTYTNSGYEPSILTVKDGTSVTFKNNSTHSMWTASNDHPTHRLYPESGGCIGSKFDACKGIMPGESWTFKFDIAGTWKYHNHLEPGDTGTIVVQ